MWGDTDNTETLLKFFNSIKDALAPTAAQRVYLMDNMRTHWSVEAMRWLEGEGILAEHPPSYTPQANNPSERVFAIIRNFIQRSLIEMNQEQRDEFTLE